MSQLLSFSSFVVDGNKLDTEVLLVCSALESKQEGVPKATHSAEEVVLRGPGDTSRPSPPSKAPAWWSMHFLAKQQVFILAYARYPVDFIKLHLRLSHRDKKFLKASFHGLCF